MKTIMLTFVLCLIAPIASAQEPLQSGTIELSMMDRSVDDMISGCTMKTAEKVQEVYFPREMQNNPLFKMAWNQAESCAKLKQEKLQNSTKYKKLTNDHLKALCVYTDYTPNVHDPLNTVLRDGAGTYSTEAFQYHTLYFWLTSAIQILKKSCETTYRRTENIYNGKKNQIIRFGQFASSSRNPNLSQFGSKTCFHIKTCLGAYIKDYSRIPNEEEVLIPPYEKFEILDIVNNYYENLNCKKIFVLKSVKYSSKLNCKATNHYQVLRANFALILVVQLLIGLLWNCFEKATI